MANFNMSLLIFTQARLNSQRLPKKMVRSFAKRSLWDIACEKLSNLPFPKEQKWVSVYEPELREIAEKYNLSIFDRSEASANEDNKASLIWEICGLDFERYVMFNPCLPMLEEETILGFINFFKDHNYNSAFGVKVLKDYLFDKEGKLVHPPGTTFFNTKEFDTHPERQLYVAAHCLYAGQCHDMINDVYMGDFTPNNPALYPILNKRELFDVDDYEDFLIAEAVYECR